MRSAARPCRSDTDCSFPCAGLADSYGSFAQALGVEHDLVEPVAMALSGLNRQGAGEQPDAVGVVDGGAIHVDIAAGGREAVAELKALHDVVIFEIVAARAADGLAGGRRDRRLRERRERAETRMSINVFM